MVRVFLTGVLGCVTARGFQWIAVRNPGAHLIHVRRTDRSDGGKNDRDGALKSMGDGDGDGDGGGIVFVIHMATKLIFIYLY